MPRKRKPSLEGLLIQGLSDHRTMKPEQAQRPNEFIEDIAGGSGEPIPMKIESIVDTVPTYVRTAFVVHRSKRADAAKALAQRQRTANITNKLLHAMIEPEAKSGKPKHNQTHTESGLVITVPTNPNAIKRRF